MRILHVTASYLPHRSGVTVAIDGWVRAQRDNGHEVGVWTIGTPDRAAGVWASPGFGAMADGFRVPLSVQPPREVRCSHWDVVHIHHPFVIGGSALRFGRSINAVVVSTAHSDYLAYLDAYLPPLAAVLRPALRARTRRFFSACDAVFAPSASIERALVSWGAAEKVVASTYPVDVDRLGRCSREGARAALGIAPEVPLALYAGRLAAEKRVLELLDEFAEAKRLVPDARLVIVGDGPYGSRVRRAAAGFGDAVILTGSLPSEVLGVWYSAADVFVSASRNEVGPLVSIESGLCGTPTVARRAPGFKDRIEDGVSGVLTGFEAGDLGRALAAVLADRKMAHRMGLAAREAFAEHTPEASARLLTEVYLCAERRVPLPAGHSGRRQLEVGTD